MNNKSLLSNVAKVQKEENKMNIVKKVTRGFNKVKEIKVYVKNLKTALKNEEEYLEEYDFSNLPFNEKFDFFSREDLNMAVMGISCAAVYSNLGFNSFIYNDSFMQLSEGTKEFIYYHELGHVMLKHNEKQIEDREVQKEYLRCSRKGQVHRFEYEADFFAAKKVGKWQALSALEEVKRSLGPLSSSMIDKRMETIFLSDLLD